MLMHAIAIRTVGIAQEGSSGKHARPPLTIRAKSDWIGAGSSRLGGHHGLRADRRRGAAVLRGGRHRRADHLRPRVRRPPLELGAADPVFQPAAPLPGVRRARLSALRRARGGRALFAGARRCRHRRGAGCRRHRARAHRRPVDGRVRDPAFRPRPAHRARSRWSAPGSATARTRTTRPSSGGRRRRSRGLRDPGQQQIAPVYGSAAARVQYEAKDPRGYAESSSAWPSIRPAAPPNPARRPGQAALALRSRGPARADDGANPGDRRRRGRPDPAAGIYLKRTIPACGLLVLPKTGHAINLEEPETFNRAVAEFLAQVIAGRWGNAIPGTPGRNPEDLVQSNQPGEQCLMPDDTTRCSPNLKFGIGQSVPRKEDPKLITGRGRYTDDVDLPGQAFAHPLRSHAPMASCATWTSAQRLPRRACSRSTPPPTWRGPAMASCAASCPSRTPTAAAVRAATAAHGGRPGPLCRRDSGGDRGRDAPRGAGSGRADRGRDRAPAGSD